MTEMNTQAKDAAMAMTEIKEELRKIKLAMEKGEIQQPKRKYHLSMDFLMKLS